MTEKVACFRCKTVSKVMVRLTIDDNFVYFCPTCYFYFDFKLYLSGCAVNPMVMVDNKKEAKE